MATSLTPRCYAVSSLQLRNRAVISLGAAREFSSTSTRCDESTNDSPNHPSNTGFDQTARRQNTKSLLREVFTKSSPPSSNRPLFRSFKPQSTPGPVDARSLAANVPPDGPNKGVIRRVPLSFRNLPQRGRLGRGNANQNLLAAANALSRNARRRPGQNRPQRKTGRSHRRRNGWDDDGGNVHASIQEYEDEKAEKARRKPERYNPDPYNVEKLKPTWPTLPMGEGNNVIANAGSVTEKLNWMGDRYLGSYDPPHELAKRMIEGKRVFFQSDEEKAEVLEIAQKMVNERAQKLTERKGQVVEPEKVSFEVVADHERMGLVRTLVKGEYDQPLVNEQKAGKSPIASHVLRNLTNNGTYQTVQAEKFLEKFLKGLPARLTNQKTGAA
ncbi:hypothetical protein PRK78_003987 [Emydomyces testavorans]|uniref:Uncharacterized protein n=1 Tax=Emydomyces testavorans TaxID=2070801 RepID=A0AAF0DHW8_9EURO|nr:hypothetical protein PRK78_003987 [Emydomyces testavorans]